jgi:hypothetical protein
MLAASQFTHTVIHSDTIGPLVVCGRSLGLIAATPSR